MLVSAAESLYICISYIGIPEAGIRELVFQAGLESCQCFVVVVGPCRLAAAAFSQTDAAALVWWAGARRRPQSLQRSRFRLVSIGTSAAPPEAYSAPVPLD